MTRVRIISDGTAATTKVLVDGKMLPGVQSVVLCVSLDQPRAEAVIHVRGVDFDVVAEARP